MSLRVPLTQKELKFVSFEGSVGSQGALYTALYKSMQLCTNFTVLYTARVWLLPEFQGGLRNGHAPSARVEGAALLVEIRRVEGAGSPR